MSFMRSGAFVGEMSVVTNMSIDFSDMRLLNSSAHSSVGFWNSGISISSRVVYDRQVTILDSRDCSDVYGRSEADVPKIESASWSRIA